MHLSMVCPRIGEWATHGNSSSETQGQIVGVRESLNRRKNMAQKKSKERREEPLGTMSYQTSSKQSPPFWLLIGARKLVFFWHQSEARTAATVWNWSGKTLSPGALLAVLHFPFVPYFSACLDFPSPPLSAHGSPRMMEITVSETHMGREFDILNISRVGNLTQLPSWKVGPGNEW